MINPALFSSKGMAWETPDNLRQELYNEFGPFSLDAAAGPENTLAEIFFSEGALEKDWSGAAQGGWIFCNPPYGRDVGKWVKKAWQENRQGNANIVMLLAARTDTAWFHDYIQGNFFAQVRFLRGRLRFRGAKHPAPFPSMIVIFRSLQKGAA